MNNREIVNEYIRVLNLPNPDMETIDNYLEFLAKLDTQEQNEILVSIAELFCTCMKYINKTKLTDEEYAMKILMTFNNIKGMEINEQLNQNVHVATIKFLSDLRSFSEYEGSIKIEETTRNTYELLCDNLEKMSGIFQLSSKNQKLFPIGKLLNHVIEREEFLSSDKLDEVTFNTLLLALEIFKPNEFKQEYQTIKAIIERYNLQCLSYLTDATTKKIGGERRWKDNLKHNGVLGMIVSENNETAVIVRHTDRSYFGDNIELEIEKNSKGNAIAYFNKRTLPKDTICITTNEIFESNSILEYKMLCNEIFKNKAYNIFGENSLVKYSDGRIEKTNLFTSKDSYIIFEINQSLKSDIENVVQNVFLECNFQRIGKKFDFIIWRSVFKLLEIDASPLSEMFTLIEQKPSMFQSQLIQCWAEHTVDFKKNIVLLQDIYFNETSYVKKRNDLLNKNISEIKWIPTQFPAVSIQKWLEDNYNVKEDGYEIKKIKAEEDFSGKIIYKNAETEEKCDIDKQDFEDEVITQGVFYILYNKSIEKYSFKNDVNDMFILLLKIEQENVGLYTLQELNEIQEGEISAVIDMMRLQKQALSEIKGRKCDFESIAYLRLFHHLIYCQISEPQKWEDFYKMLQINQVLKFDNIKNMIPFDDACLVVPKEQQSTDNTLCSIVNQYVLTHSERSHCIYNTELYFQNGKYKQYNDVEINKIMILFDTLQSGSSTREILEGYFENNDSTTRQICRYYCNGKKLKLENIISMNNAEIEVCVLYGSVEGKAVIDDYIQKHNVLVEAKQINCINKINNKLTDKELQLITSIYGTDKVSIKSGRYPIIREFNQPKMNMFPEEVLNSECIASIFIKKRELRRIKRSNYTT